MGTIGNSLAFGILFLIYIIFSRTKYFLTKASEYYRISLWLAIVTALLSTVRLEVTKLKATPEWLAIGITTVEFFFVFILTTVMALYLISKVTEHILEDSALKFAKKILIAIAIMFSIALIINIPTRYIFDFDAERGFVDSTFYYLPYLILIPQFILVLLYCIQHIKTLNRSILFALFESCLAIGFTIVIKFMYNVSILALALSFIQLIFLLEIQRQKMGVNSVTKLNDGRSFFSELKTRIKKTAKFKTYLIQIDNIGIIKQNYGQKIGDEVLYRFATSLKRLFLDGAAFHMHSTSFTLITNTDENIPYSDKILEFLDGGITLGNKTLKLDYVVAEHTWQQNEQNAEEFYEKLEYALEIARENNRNFITYSLDLEIARLRKKYLINRMQNISRSEGFEIWFQPIFNNHKERFSSVEVLLRLKEQNGSFISPAEFIPIAEKTAQITNITWFVIEETCRALSQNPELDAIRASINLPMLHLVDPSFEGRLNEIVDKYNVSHNRISFEFTERVILDDLSIAEKNMRRLAKSGYTFYLDDFGVGYSNFNCVLRLPLKTVKLDMTLTSTTETLAENRNLVSILTDLFHDMGLQVVAEGAESEEQVNLLRSFGVDGIQGYYFAKPMPIAKLKDFLKKNKK